jgi:hypothetical protein
MSYTSKGFTRSTGTPKALARVRRRARTSGCSSQVLTGQGKGTPWVGTWVGGPQQVIAVTGRANPHTFAVFLPQPLAGVHNGVHPVPRVLHAVDVHRLHSGALVVVHVLPWAVLVDVGGSGQCVPVAARAATATSGAVRARPLGMTQIREQADRDALQRPNSAPVQRRPKVHRLKGAATDHLGATVTAHGAPAPTTPLSASLPPPSPPPPPPPKPPASPPPPTAPTSGSQVLGRKSAFWYRCRSC